jgi:MFS family permease
MGIASLHPFCALPLSTWRFGNLDVVPASRLAPARDNRDMQAGRLCRAAAAYTQALVFAPKLRRHSSNPASAMTSPAIPEIEAIGDSGPWLRNLWVCVFGSFTTIVAMTLLLPFLPLYVEELGVSDHAAIVQWSGIAFGATFFTAALTAPLWGRLADRYGRKLMLIRASLGMAVAMSLIGMAHNVWQLVGLRLLAGLLGGVLPSRIGIRATFLLAGAVIFITFIGTTFLIREEKRSPKQRQAQSRGGWSLVADKRPIVAMLATGALLMIANMSIEPIITVYVAQLVAPAQVTLVAGVVMSATAFGAALSSSRLGKLADRIGHWNIVIVCLAVAAVLLIPQAFVTSGWQLIGLRFLMGLALGGLLPCIASVIRHNAPEAVTGTLLGYSVSAQYTGQVIGPLAGGYVGGHIGMRSVFLATCVLMALGAVGNVIVARGVKRH